MIDEKIKQFLPAGANFEFSGNSAVFEVPAGEIIKLAAALRANSMFSLKLITATDERAENGCFRIWYVYGVSSENIFIIPYIRLSGTEEFPSVASAVHEAWDYERRIQAFFGLTPAGHPDARPIILHSNWPGDAFPLRKDFHWQTRPASAKVNYKFQKVKGEGIYEISVGPIHAGIIEPGYFKISVAGELIVLLEPKLGYTHKGSEKLFEVLPLNDKVRLAEKISGDSSFSHSLAFCQAIEQLGGITVPKRMLYLRVIFAEMERLANHLGDIGAIMLDTGYNFGGAQSARLREMVMRINQELSGSRFLRGVNVIGGITKDITKDNMDRLSEGLSGLLTDFSDVIAATESSSSLLNRLKGTGVLSYKVAKDRGVFGVPAKALGIAYDARRDFPYAAYKDVSIDNVATEQGGDAYARFCVRVKEVYASVKLIQSALSNIPDETGALPKAVTLKKDSFAVSCVEGWRGEIVYFVTTGADGKISRVFPRDPSCVNWALLRNASFENIVPDFPLINKSFNLSYSGNDL
jgi:Ni,Fe-hydrogenase III large subunit/Ni,Fe-hydrogenase III component G